ncbi:hypothetical protein KIN20_002457 [Parelaphostrongylus tenuis]|uniref:Uncharacterized protein n=1 Tax=Parelaphostrongylus tenuis TaxID=148309 RepID=A0AAD5ME75_PARTN|nr:hypothetical protein KIN20_002457 [Parelaphostrongylus tenuis]
MLIAARVEPSSFPAFSGSKQQRPMERLSKAILEIARRFAQPFYAVHEEEEKRIACWKYWDPYSGDDRSNK